MSDIIRIYPIRTSKKKWKIPIYCYHKCGPICGLRFTFNVNLNNNIGVTTNLDYLKHGEKCNIKSKIERSFIRLSSFDLKNPCCCNGPLYDPNMKVINDTCFKITLSYPLNNDIQMAVHSPESNGFTLKQLIYTIKLLYAFIYCEEERTDREKVYSIVKLCELCGSKNYIDYTHPVSGCDTANEQCCICFMPYTHSKKGFKLDCNHVFHKDCIYQWFNNSITCPLCRYNIFDCEKCDGYGLVTIEYTGVVIPLSQRGIVQQRNRTYGRFGIHTCDFEDLILYNLVYDKEERQLYINVC
jgi:hypothetical protein